MQIYTIGYEGLNQKAFLAWLQHYEINVIADVRQLPLSRKKGFSKTSLNESLAKNNIEYISCRELGTSKEMRSKLLSTGDYKKFFEEYKNKICDKTEQINELYKIVNSGKKIALLCFEHDAHKCHRKIIA
ncbi:MAG: DUF488 domain-containing protein, partial [Deltaproteobacteria bacterium]|nr:DUF488 domain-containing protein [Deltaproteobacteria bacterium]